MQRSSNGTHHDMPYPKPLLLRRITTESFQLRPDANPQAVFEQFTTQLVPEGDEVSSHEHEVSLRVRPRVIPDDNEEGRDERIPADLKPVDDDRLSGGREGDERNPLYDQVFFTEI